MKTNKIRLISSISIASIVILVAIAQYTRDNQRFNDVKSTYPRLTAIDSINNVVLEIYIPKNSRYVEELSHIILDNNDRYTIIATINCDGSLIGINEVLQTGDHLWKKSDSDTIILQRTKEGQTEEYKFVLYTQQIPR